MHWCASVVGAWGVLVSDDPLAKLSGAEGVGVECLEAAFFSTAAWRGLEVASRGLASMSLCACAWSRGFDCGCVKCVRQPSTHKPITTHNNESMPAKCNACLYDATSPVPGSHVILQWVGFSTHLHQRIHNALQLLRGAVLIASHHDVRLAKLLRAVGPWQTKKCTSMLGAKDERSRHVELKSMRCKFEQIANTHGWSHTLS